MTVLTRILIVAAATAPLYAVFAFAAAPQGAKMAARLSDPAMAMLHEAAVRSAQRGYADLL